MYVDDLLMLFDEAASTYPGLGSPAVREELRQAIVAKKYDLQDEALIEAILRDDSRELVDSFTGSMERVLGNTGTESGGEELLGGDKIKREAIRIYIASLEHLINYYYNSLVGKHFSST